MEGRATLRTMGSTLIILYARIPWRVRVPAQRPLQRRLFTVGIVDLPTNVPATATWVELRMVPGSMFRWVLQFVVVRDLLEIRREWYALCQALAKRGVGVDILLPVCVGGRPTARDNAT